MTGSLLSGQNLIVGAGRNLIAIIRHSSPLAAIEQTAPRTQDSYEYIEYAIAGSQQRVVLQFGKFEQKVMHVKKYHKGPRRWKWNSCKILIRKLEEMMLNVRPWYARDDNVKENGHGVIGWFSWLRKSHGPRRHSNELPDSGKGGELIHQLGDINIWRITLFFGALYVVIPDYMYILVDNRYPKWFYPCFQCI